MAKFLSDDQLERVRRELTILFSLPYANDLFGTAWEQILAEVKGGRWTELRDNRPRPDIFLPLASGGRKNYSVKCERLAVTAGRKRSITPGRPTKADAAGFLGDSMDFIIARPKVDELLSEGQSIADLDATELGGLVLRYYNEQIVQKYEWHALSFVAPVIFPDETKMEFVYWEEEPPTVYRAKDYWWRDTGKATGGNRNIAGYPNDVSRENIPLPASKFRWNSGGKQFYIRYDIPRDADVWAIERVRLSREELWKALQRKLAAKKRNSGSHPIT